MVVLLADDDVASTWLCFLLTWDHGRFHYCNCQSVFRCYCWDVPKQQFTMKLWGLWDPIKYCDNNQTMKSHFIATLWQQNGSTYSSKMVARQQQSGRDSTAGFYTKQYGSALPSCYYLVAFWQQRFGSTFGSFLVAIRCHLLQNIYI